MSTWNPSDKSANITLSGGNLVTTWNGSAGGVRSTTSKTSGKLYFEFTINAFNADDFIGLANSTYSLGTFTNTSNVIAAAIDSSAIKGNATNIGSTGGAIGTGTVAVAIDFGSSLFWYTPSATVPVWNGGGTNNPATGVGGISFSYLTGPFFLYAGAGAGGVGQQGTLNTGNSTFAGTVPSGFNAWDVAINIGSSDGVAAVSGVGQAIVSGVGTATGVAAVAGVSRAIFNAIGTAAGVAAVVGVAPTYTNGVGTSTGTSSVSGVGRTILKAIGTAAGQAAVLGDASPASLGVATGQASALGISSSIILSVGTANGSADVEGFECVPTAPTIISAVGRADGQASVIGIALGFASSVGRADGQANVNGISTASLVYVGTSDGQAFVQGISMQPALVFGGASLLVGL